MLPLLYHTHHSLHPEDLPFWSDLAAQAHGPILELGCGTGRVLLHLAQEGHTVYGLDHDFAMLSFLHRRIPTGLAGRVHILQADFAHLNIRQRFALAIMPCNTYSTLSQEIRQALLSALRQFLLPDGCFAFSMPNPAMLRRLPRRSEAQVEEIFTHPTSGEPVQVSSAWQRSRQFFTVTWHYDHLLPDGAVQRLSAAIQHNLIPVQIYLDELHAAGLQPVTIYGDYALSPFAETSANAIVITRL